MCRDRRQAIVWIDGQRLYLGRWGTPEAEERYNRLIAEWLSNGKQLPLQSAAAAEPTTVTEILLAYWRYAKRRYSRGEADTIKQALRQVRALYGSEPVTRFGPKRLRTVRDAMIRIGWSRGHINKQISRVRAAFRWAASYELCDVAICRQLQTVEPLKRGDVANEGRTVRPVPRSTVRRARRYVTRPVRALIDLQLLTGARADELVRLRPTDLDVSGEVWTVTYDGSDCSRSHKTLHHGKVRTIYFGPRAQRILKMFMKPGKSLDHPIFSPRDADSEGKRRHGRRGRRPNQKATPKKTKRRIGEA
ncbi:MAG: hypothetical protein EA377_12750 [Phycisphaerales bacterium]|nr:MAG: hypothetical protein EA377_12750 [Phycisphaerales bacterium]